MLSFENFAHFAHLPQHFSPISFLSLPIDYIESVLSYALITHHHPTCRHHTFISSQTLPFSLSPHAISIAGKSERVEFWVTWHSHFSPSSPSHTLVIVLTHRDELFTHSHFHTSLYNTAFSTQLPPSLYLSSSSRNNTKVESWHFRDTTKIVQNRYRWNSFHSYYLTPLPRFYVSTMKLLLLFPQWH